MPTTISGSPGGTAMVSGAMPAFSAYASVAQSISQGVFTRIQYNIEEFDTNSNYNTSTYRFTPTVAGYYQVTACISWASICNSMATIHKNGVEFKRGNYIGASVSTSESTALIYMNGTTDYVEGFCYQFQTSTLNTSVSQSTAFFQAVMVRAA